MVRSPVHRSSPSPIVDLLASLSERIVVGASIEESLEFVYATFKTVLPYDRMGFAKIDPEAQTVHARWLKSREKTHLGSGYAAPLAGSSLALVLEHRLPRVLNDLSAYLQQHPDSESTRLIIKEGMKSSMTCPLFVGGQPYAFLFFSSMTLDAFDKSHVAIMKAIGNQLALLLMVSQVERSAPVTPRSERAVPAERSTQARVPLPTSTLSFGELKAGMVIGAPVMLTNGRVLVSSGVALTGHAIDRVIALYAEGYIRDEVVQVRTTS